MWHSLSVVAQNWVLLGLLLLPVPVVGFAVLRGFRPGRLVGAMLWRYRWANVMFVLLIAVSVGLGIGLLAQERGLRRGTAHAADKFDLIIGAPGGDFTLMMAAVYLQPSAVPLIGGEVYAEIASHPHATLTAPLAFGDSYGGAPVVGTTAEFVRHLSDGAIEGRMFAKSGEVVVGATAPLSIGDRFDPDHGRTAAEVAQTPGAHAGAALLVTGRMSPTGTPWDRAILVPVESVWELHGLANGHALDAGDKIGPPFDPDYFPGTPAAIVHTDQLFAAYAIRAQFNQRVDTMAVFPGSVLSRLYLVLGDIRQAMSVMAIVTQVLVAAAVLVGLFVLTLLFRRQMALLHALGAPRRFVFGVIWGYAAALLAGGALLGMGVGQVATAVLSRVISARTDIVINAPLGWPEIHFVAAFLAIASVLALLPALAAGRAQGVAGLRA